MAQWLRDVRAVPFASPKLHSDMLHGWLQVLRSDFLPFFRFAAHPFEVIEQITYLLFLKRLDEQETAEGLKANQTKKPMLKRFFPDGKDDKKRSFQEYRWKNFKHLEARDMFTVIDRYVFPWLRT